MRENDLILAGVVMQDENLFSSLCLELDIASQGETVAQAKNGLAEAVALYLETAIENNVPYLRPVPREDDPRFATPSEIIETFPLRVNDSASH